MKTQQHNTRSIAARQQLVDSREHGGKVTKPLTSDMVVAAISALKDSSGSSAQSIKNYIKTNYGGSPSIGPALKSAATAGKVVLVVGKGAMCTYKLAQKGTYKLAQKGKSKTLRGKGAVRKNLKATCTDTKASSAILASKIQAKDAKKVAKKVCKRPTSVKATSSKISSAKKTPKGASKKQEGKKSSKKTSKKRDTKKTAASDTRENLFSSFGLCGHFLQLPKIARGSSVIPATMIHTKARHPIYPNSTTGRLPVPDDKVPWTVEWPEYNPVKYTADHVKAAPVWADPDIRQKGGPTLKFNCIDGKVNRRSYIGNYDCVDGVPRNPCGRTGMIERGLLGKWGPNHAADPIVTRWKRDSSGKKVLHPTSGKPILQFISIRRKDSGEWAIPGGMVDAGEKVSQTLKREFGEEAMDSLSLQDKECKTVEKAVANLFKHGVEVYRGYVDDPRNTDNSWMETMAVNFHDDKGTSVAKFSLHAGDDAAAVQWHDVGSDMKLYASHTSFIEVVTKRIGAHW